MMPFLCIYFTRLHAEFAQLQFHTMFRATSRLRDCRITFFTRNPCSLCDTAKAVVGNVKAKRPFTYHEVNVMEPGQEKWKSVYEFDTPVVRLFP